MQSYSSFLETRELAEMAERLVDAGIDVQAFCECVEHAVRKVKYKRLDQNRSILYVANEAVYHFPEVMLAEAGPFDVGGGSADLRVAQMKKDAQAKPWYSRMFSGIGSMFGGGSPPGGKAHQARTQAATAARFQNDPAGAPAGRGKPVLTPIKGPGRYQNRNQFMDAAKGYDSKYGLDKAKGMESQYRRALVLLKDLQHTLSQLPGPSGKANFNIRNLVQVANTVYQAMQKNTNAGRNGGLAPSNMPSVLPADGDPAGGGDPSQLPISDPRNPRSPFTGKGAGGPAAAAAAPADPRSARDQYEAKVAARFPGNPALQQQMMAQYDATQQHGANQQAMAAKAQQFGFAKPEEYQQWVTDAGSGDAQAGQQRIDQAMADAQKAGIPVAKAVQVMKAGGINQPWEQIAKRMGVGPQAAAAAGS